MCHSCGSSVKLDMQPSRPDDDNSSGDRRLRPRMEPYGPSLNGTGRMWTDEGPAVTVLRPELEEDLAMHSPRPVREKRQKKGPAASDMITVEVNSLSGSVIANFMMPLVANVTAVKERVQRETGIPATEQKLILGDKVLTDECILWEAAGQPSTSTESEHMQCGSEGNSTSLMLTMIRNKHILALCGGGDGTLRL